MSNKKTIRKRVAPLEKLKDEIIHDLKNPAPKKEKVFTEEMARREYGEKTMRALRSVVKTLPKGTRIRTIRPYKVTIQMQDMPSKFENGKLTLEAGLLSTYIFLINEGLGKQECYVQVDAISRLHDNPDFAREMANLGSEAAHLKFKINVNNYESSTNESENESDSKNSK